MGPTVYYNGVLLKDCVQHDFQISEEVDESKSVRFVRILIAVESTLVALQSDMTDTTWQGDKPNDIASLFPTLGTNQGLMTDQIQAITHALSQPRKDFWYAVKGGTAINTAGSGAIPQNNSERTDNYRIMVVATGIIPADTSTAQTYVNGAVTTRIDAAGTDVKTKVKRRLVLDANNGPHVSNLKVSRIIGGQAMRVQAVFEICRVIYEQGSDDRILNEDPDTIHYDAQKVKGVTFNRWRVTDSMDNDGIVTHTLKGKLTVKDQRYKPNACRWATFCLPFAFARVTDNSYTVSEDGLTLEYERTMRTAGAAPPDGARNYEAIYTEQALNPGFITAMMTIKVWGWYDRSTSEAGNPTNPVNEASQKQMLLRAAHTILWSRIRGINKLWNPVAGQLAKNTILRSFKVQEKLGRPELEIFVAVDYTAERNNEFHLRMLRLGTPMSIDGYDPRWWPIDNVWGRLPYLDYQNPYFASANIPHGGSGNDAESDYLSAYYTEPYNPRHTIPRITTDTQHNASSDIDKWPWANLDGSTVSSDTVSPPSNNPKSPNPIAVGTGTPKPFSALVSKDLLGNDRFGPEADSINDSYTGLSIDQQTSGFAYIQWDSEVLSDGHQGIVHLPLSVPREVTPAMIGYPVRPGESVNPLPKQTAVAVRLFSGIGKRVYSIVATRIGDWPKTPEPMPIIFRTAVVGSSTVIANREVLLKKEIITDGPELGVDTSTFNYTIHMRLTYALDKPPGATANQGGDANYSVHEVLPVIVNPIAKANFDQTCIVNARYVYDPSLIS